MVSFKVSYNAKVLHKKIMRLQNASWPTQGSSCASNTYNLFSSSIEMSNLFLKVSTVPAKQIFTNKVHSTALMSSSEAVSTIA